MGDNIGRLKSMEVFFVHAEYEVAHHVWRQILGRSLETVQDGVAVNDRLVHGVSIAKARVLVRVQQASQRFRHEPP